MAFDLLTELIELAKLFEREGIDYAICGGIAVAIHGYPRATEDLDILIQESDIKVVEDLAREAGFTLSSGIIPFSAGKPNERKILRLSKVQGEDLLTLDLLLVAPILEAVWSDRIRVLVKGHKIQVVSKDGLIRMKQVAGRLSDLSDIQRLTGEEQ